MNFDLDSLKCFVTFAERLNFTHAAEELHISQPALFVKIQSLAREIGTPVYRKVGRTLELTDAGAKLLLFSRETLRRADSFAGSVMGEERETVVLAAGEGSYLYLLGPAIQRFVRKNAVQLQLLTATRAGIIDAVQSGRADLGVASLETIPSGCVSRSFHIAEQMLVMPPQHRLASKRRITLSDLQNEKLIVPPPDRQHRQVLAQALQSAGVRWEVAVEASGWELMIKFVQLGLGCAVVNSICALPKGVAAKPLPQLPKIHYHLFHRKGPLSAAADELLRQIL